ncbi:MAG TPA: hypothetical protein VMD91_06900 [Candidatus Sulfotelmatobacter sp.]|nr:hypothetical protein [Candidatus Sulfotelmatobacter sp.]
MIVRVNRKSVSIVFIVFIVAAFTAIASEAEAVLERGDFGLLWFVEQLGPSLIAIVLAYIASVGVVRGIIAYAACSLASTAVILGVTGESYGVLAMLEWSLIRGLGALVVLALPLAIAYFLIHPFKK